MFWFLDWVIVLHYSEAMAVNNLSSHSAGDRVANSFSKQYCEENRQSTKQKPAPDLWSPVGAGKDHRYGGAKSGKQLIDHGHLHPDGCLAWANGAWHSRPYSASTRTNIPFQTIAVDRSRGSG